MFFFFFFFAYRFLLKRTTIIFSQSNTFQSTNSLKFRNPIWPTQPSGSHLFFHLEKEFSRFLFDARTYAYLRKKLKIKLEKKNKKKKKKNKKKNRENDQTDIEQPRVDQPCSRRLIFSSSLTESSI